MRHPRMLVLSLAACPIPGPDEMAEPLACEPYHLEPQVGFDEQAILGDEEPEAGSAAIALGDLDGDGWLDAMLAFSTGRSIAARNDGAGNLLDDGALTVDGGPFPTATALAVGDIEGDGDLDLFLGQAKGMQQRLLLNDGRGGFRSIPLPDAEGSELVGTLGSAAFGDLDADGDLDLFLSRYIDPVDPHAILSGTAKGGGNSVYRNEGGLFFPDTRALPEEVLDDITFHGQLVDTDRDGDLDIYLSNDFGAYAAPNRLLENDGTGRFTVDHECTCDLTMFGMGAAVGDADGDGWPDLYVTDIGGPSLLVNAGDGTFLEAAHAFHANIPPTIDRLASWGSAFVDLDLDGWEDLAVVFGKVSVGAPDDALEAFDPSFAGFVDAERQRDALLLNDGTRFTEVSETVGFDDDGVGRSVAAGDLDRDGLPDLVVAGAYYVRVYRGQGGCSTSVTLVPGAGATPVGVEVEAVVDARTLVRRLAPSTTFSSSAPEIVLGLGGHDRIEQLTARWLDGRERTWRDVEAGAIVVLEP